MFANDHVSIFLRKHPSEKINKDYFASHSFFSFYYYFFFILTLKTFLEVLVYDEIKIKLWMEWKGPWISAVMEREWFHELHFELYQTVVFLWMVHVKCKGWIFSLCIIIIQIRLTGITIITLTWNVTGKFCSYNCTQDVMKNNNKTLLWILRFSNLCNFNTFFVEKHCLTTVFALKTIEEFSCRSLGQ